MRRKKMLEAIKIQRRISTKRQREKIQILTVRHLFFSKSVMRTIRSFSTTNGSKITITLSTEFWWLKNVKFNPFITWRIVRTAPSYYLASKKCQVCLAEKYANYPEPDREILLDKWREIILKWHCWMTSHEMKLCQMLF